MKLLFLILICLSILSGSCTSNNPTGNKLETISKKDSISSDQMEPNNMNEINELINQFQKWMEQENAPFIKVMDDNPVILSGPGDEWDGEIPNYGKYKKEILIKAENSISESNFFTKNFKLDRKKTAKDTNEFGIDNLPSLLLKSKDAFHVTNVYLPDEIILYSDSTLTKELLTGSYEKLNDKKIFIKCIPTYNSVFEPSNIILEIIKIEREWKIDNISFINQ